jgi:hypothetical protein
MGLLDRLFGNDRERAATQYAGRESASASAARKRRAQRSRSATRADRKGQAWEDTGRSKEVTTDWYRR